MEQYVIYALQTLKYEQEMNYSKMNKTACDLYNYFTHNPEELLTVEQPLEVGTAFLLSKGFKYIDNTQEVLAENAVLCLYQAFLEQKNPKEKIAASLFIVFQYYEKHLRQLMMQKMGATEFGIMPPLGTLPYTNNGYEEYLFCTTDERLYYIKAYLQSLIPEYALDDGLLFNSLTHLNLYNKAYNDFQKNNSAENQSKEDIAKAGPAILDEFYLILKEEVNNYSKYLKRKQQ